MKELKKFLTMEDCFKDLAKKRIPELSSRDDFEVRYEKDILCPVCGTSQKNSTGSLSYKLFGTDEWIQFQVSNCSTCRDQEAFEVYQERSLYEQRQEIGQRLTREYYFIPEDLKNAGFKNFEDTNKITQRAKATSWIYAKKYVEDPENRYNLLVMGNPGTGKSHLCAAVARYIKDNGYNVGFLTTGKLLSLIKATYKKGAEKTEEDILQDLKKLDLLILDDLGSEAIGGNDDWRKSMIFEIVNSRIGKPTIYTSNLTDIDLPIAVGDRVFSRLYNNTKFIDLFIENYDYRKKLMAI